MDDVLYKVYKNHIKNTCSQEVYLYILKKPEFIKNRVGSVKKQGHHKALKYFKYTNIHTFAYTCQQNLPIYMNRYIYTKEKIIKIAAKNKLGRDKLLRDDKDFFSKIIPAYMHQA